MSKIQQQAGAVHFSVEPGRVYELRVLFQRQESYFNGGDLSSTSFRCSFYDDDGRKLDPRLENGEPVVPFPETVEVLPAGELNDALTAAGTVSIFLLASPDAARLEVDGWLEDVVLRRVYLHETAIEWPGKQGQHMAKHFEEIANARVSLIRRELDVTEASEPILSEMAALPQRQIAALRAYFKSGGDWQPLLDDLHDADGRADYRLRCERLRSQAERVPRVGFIGSERGRERLEGMAEVVWLREAELEDQLRYLDLDLIVVETTATSGAGAEDVDWQLAFSSLTGDLPEKGEALFAAAEAAGVPVHLWATGAPEKAVLWLGAARRAHRIVAEGSREEWSPLQPDHVAPRATEPVACSLAYLKERPQDLMLVPAASDILQFPDFAALVNATSLYATAIAEFHYKFAKTALRGYLRNPEILLIGEHNRTNERALLPAARIVLLPARSLRSDSELAQTAMDAIACGAIPVLYGTPRGGEALLDALDRVYSLPELIELQALYRITWVRERQWRKLFRNVMRNHVWKSADRAALLGNDPFEAGFDTPRVSAVLVTKRPHLMKQCFETFRRQSWENKELVLVFNTGVLPDDLPVLMENEWVFALPEASNIGECLNRGIGFGSGKYWVKMDDDDYYSETYLEETAYYYRSTQADSVGRQSVFFYFDGNRVTSSREKVRGRTQQLLRVAPKIHVAGATLSARASQTLPLFSLSERNSCDSNWIQRMVRDGWRIFGGDGTSMIVYRAPDESSHTWKLSTANQAAGGWSDITQSNLFDRIERS